MHASRSHTDALTNLVVLSSFDIGRHFQEIVDRDLPIATLPTFLHEATHHWCFDTPVGLALHLLFMRARRAALRPEGENRWQILDSVVRYEVARDFIYPLSEGIALFAEHDAIPGAAKTISTPMMSAAALYGRGYAFEGEQPYETLPLVLAGARISRGHTRRKAALLLEPMSCAKGGYLPGYMLVKGLWRHAWPKSELFRDSDFFLQYLRAQLFDDWGLVARLLDDNKKDIGALDAIMSHIAARLRNFIEVAVDGDRPRRFEAAGADNEYEVLQVRTKLLHTDIRFHRLDDDADLELGRKRLEEGLAAHFADWTGDALTDAILNQDLTELTERGIVNLGHIKVEGQPLPEGLQLSRDGEPVVTFAAERFPEIAKIAGPLDLELLSLETPGGLCITLRQEGRFLSSIPIGANDLPDHLKTRLSTREERAERAKLSYELINDALAQADLHVTADAIRGTLRQTLEEWLIPLALMDVGEERLAGIRERMRERGFLNIFGADKELLLDAAVAGLCIPSPYNFDSVATFHHWCEPIPQRSILRIAETVITELGFPPFLLDENDAFEKAWFL